MGKEEIARYEQYLLFQQCCQKTSTADMWKPGLVQERVNPFLNDKLGQTEAFCRQQNKCNLNCN